MHRIGQLQLTRCSVVVAVAVIGLCCPLAAAAHAGQRILQQIDLVTSREGAALTLVLSTPVRQRLSRLHVPERLVIDLPDTLRHGPLPPVPPGSVVTALRWGVHDHYDLRLVLELNTALAVSLSRRNGPAGSQLRIQLGTPTRAAPTRSLAALSAAPRPVVPPRVTARALRAAHAPTEQRDVIVAIDPGHGGVDPGATGRDGVHEKEVTLAIARALAADIDHEPGMRSVLTRDGDYFVPLRDRMERARAAHADMFISIHADSVADPEVSGASIYILSERGATSEAARRLADEENAADLKGGISLAAQAPQLRSVLLNLSQSASIGESGEAAQRVLGALDAVGAVRKREVQQAAFVVLKSPDMPSMLIETAYISNSADELRLRSPAQQQQLAGAILHGIANYFRQYPPQGSLFAHAHGLASAASS